MDNLKYMTITTIQRSPRNRVSIRISKRNPDEPCECEEEGYEGKDVHNDIVMTFDIEDLRVFDGAGMVRMHDLERANSEFVVAYLECALWSSSGDNDIPLDQTFALDDLSSELMSRVERDCAMFVRLNEKLIDGNWKLAGHDFWLTRNGHGAGFWDGGYWSKEAGERMTQSSNLFGEVDLYVGDDGKLYI